MDKTFEAFKNGTHLMAGPRGGALPGNLQVQVSAKGAVALKFHGHPIVVESSEGVVTIDPCGYSQSPTTMGHIRRGLACLGLTMPKSYFDDAPTVVRLAPGVRPPCDLPACPSPGRVRKALGPEMLGHVCSITPLEDLSGFLVKTRERGSVYSYKLSNTKLETK